MHDVVIIGGGPAGMTASVYAARKALDQVFISPDVGGQATWASEVENYLGCPFIRGFDLVTKFEEHIIELGVSRVDDRVISLEEQDKAFLVRTEGGREFRARTAIAASGRSARNLGVPGEEKFKGRGVTYCATCDAPLYAGEDVAVVGGGNAGLDAAVQLTRIARTVFVIEEMESLTGDKQLQDHIGSADNARILTHTEVTEVKGNRMVESISVRDMNTGGRMDILVAGIFVEIGSLPNIHFLPAYVRVDSRGEVIVDCSNRTNVPGLFAAGDVTNVPGKQIIIAAGEGAKALLAAYEYISRNSLAERRVAGLSSP